MIDVDVRASQRIRGVVEDRPIARGMAGLIAHSADWWWWLIGAAGIWWARGAARPAVTIVVTTITVTAIAVQSMKWIVRRKRPPGERDFLSRHTDPHSFPSGHAARASALAAVAIMVGPWCVALPLSLWAVLVTLVRVVMGVHYLSDVIVGVVVGLACGTMVVDRVAVWLG